MEIIELRGEKALARLGGVEREISLVLVDDAALGDYVLVHAGFAISRIDEDVAAETISLLKEKYGSAPEEDSRASPADVSGRRPR